MSLKFYSNTSVEIFLILSLNYLPFPGKVTSFIYPLVYALPRLYLIATLGNVFSHDFKRCAVYIFTRKDSRLSWYFNKLYFISLYILSFLITFVITTTLFALANKFRVESFFKGILCCTIIILLNFISIILFTIVANILSLYMSSRISFLFTITVWLIFFVPFFISLNDFNYLLIKFSPVLQAVLSWHSDRFIVDITGIYGIDSINGFSIWWSMFILAIYFSIVVIIGIKVVKNIEIFERD
ncbi:hypothetical protein B0S90_0962 [Caldicellulosiruptor bescii]|uniref:ABC-2 type transporter n=3 Tax=Caldicellulosiruptor bescii TaxID=31899 RepID=B9MQ03_CALBD|nr:hypothetical protein Athe_0676 [Caldicellulosiruptor bescii DSM 6725]PBC87206.1 hypothetical protein B0S87_0092 [Caldicellulosiruptor bescii]PBC90145.1 hypothetical protein B0S89_0465 [Caldicellulosiruptor bescii]PBD04425.1 hypothetical protein B0S85_2083 [Caldicellulosiruptor bescii]PBD05942.1 hypothetical protein B0S90_0962 [Caldicellulosiruptor bescii]